MENRTKYLKAPWGSIYVSYNKEHITHLEFSNVTESQEISNTDPQCLQQLAHWLDSYFMGRRQKPFPLKYLDLKEQSPFRVQVWKQLIQIPWGQTRSYKWVAQQLGQPTASRAVGGANGANPFPIIIPCHRVITSSGELGGYSGGLSFKKKLLSLEGCTVH